ncbi:hypothetical protein SAMN04487993_10403 [Salipiger marinus]|uniref:Uncharacterized protein n=1 Tax=Salipiger marinus TaxID=555512 RepID=A0A1G8UDX8_9RHOB|nr:hypothetical protein SAMN04487993_10403 [Salipiger marinus]
MARLAVALSDSAGAGQDERKAPAPAAFIGSLARCPDVIAQGPGRRQLIRPECPFSRFILWPETPLGSADGEGASHKTAPVLSPGGGLSLDAIPKISPHSASRPRRARCPIPLAPPVSMRQAADFRTRRSKVGEKSTSPWRSMARRWGPHCHGSAVCKDGPDAGKDHVKLLAMLLLQSRIRGCRLCGGSTLLGGKIKPGGLFDLRGHISGNGAWTCGALLFCGCASVTGSCAAVFVCGHPRLPWSGVF